MGMGEHPSAFDPRGAGSWKFGDATLDGASLELRVHGQLVPIERKPLNLLMLFLHRPGEVLTKDEIAEAIWTGRVISDSVLAKCVGKLRDALRDDEQIQIKTVHGYGYRFMLPVTAMASAAPESPVGLLGLAEGDSPPLRPNWRLVHRLAGSHGETWLAHHVKSHEYRVLKFAIEGSGLAGIKREITLHRLLQESLGRRNDLARLLDWNLDVPPYFLEFEYYPDGSLVEFLERSGGVESMPPQHRLELVAQAAEAVAALHSVGVLHKDLKPANLFIERSVQDAPRVRLGDFGSGRVLDPERLRALQITQAGMTQTVAMDGSTSGTWAYLAPEVIGGQAPTVQSDVYSLGVILYQLVVGDLRRPLAPGWERHVAEELLREDIAATADSDPTRRLADAAELARRLRSLEARRAARAEERAAAEHHAATQRALQRARARRGWLAATTIASLAAAVVAVIAFMQVQASRDETQWHAESAQAVNEFLIGDLIAAADPRQAGRRDVSVHQALLDAADSISDRFAGQPAIESSVRRAIGNAFLGLTDLENAVSQLSSAVDLLESAGVPVTGQAETKRDLALAYQAADATDRAEEQLRSALELLAGRPDAGALQLQLRQLLAWNDHIAGRGEQALQGLLAIEPEFRSTFAADSLELGEYLARLARVYQQQEQYDPAVDSYEVALRILGARFGRGHPRTLEPTYSLGESLRRLERFDEAEAVLLGGYQSALDSLGPAHGVTLTTQVVLASLRDSQGRQDEAVRLLEETLVLRRQHFGEHHSETLTLMNNLAATYGDLGRAVESRDTLRRVLDGRLAVQGPDHPETLVTAHNLARAHQDLEDWRSAASIQSDLVPRARRVFRVDGFKIATVLAAYSTTLARLGRRTEALAVLDEAIPLLESAPGIDPEMIARAHQRRAEVAGGQ